MESINKEAWLLLSLQSLQNNLKQSIQAIAKTYNIPETTLYSWLKRKHFRYNIIANSQKLDNLEESVLI